MLDGGSVPDRDVMMMYESGCGSQDDSGRNETELGLYRRVARGLEKQPAYLLVFGVSALFVLSGFVSSIAAVAKQDVWFGLLGVLSFTIALGATIIVVRHVEREAGAATSTEPLKTGLEPEPGFELGIPLGNYSSAAKKIQEILAYSRPRHSLRLISISGRSDYKYFLADLIRDYKGELYIDLQVIDPSSDFADIFPSHWAGEVVSTVQQIADLSQAREFHVNINLWKYQHIPFIVGAMINEDHLIMAFFGFDSSTGKLADFKEQYSYYARSQKSKKIFELYEGWFEHGPKTAWEDHAP